MACWTFAGALAFTAPVIACCVAGELLFTVFGAGFVAADGTVLVAAGSEKSAALQVIGFFG